LQLQGWEVEVFCDCEAGQGDRNDTFVTRFPNRLVVVLIG